MHAASDLFPAIRPVVMSPGASRCSGCFGPQFVAMLLFAIARRRLGLHVLAFGKRAA
jgi:hypothetical protein